jgi:uncharacterized Zn finger protein (UPF0148 family)
MNCEHCGEPLACFEGETYCPDCTYWEAVEQTERATNEARTCLARPAQAYRCATPVVNAARGV